MRLLPAAINAAEHRVDAKLRTPATLLERSSRGLRPGGVPGVLATTDRVRELDALKGDPDEVRARQSELIPLRRHGEPEEFGRAAAFLLSPRRVLYHRRDDPG
jgi:NAD(P)-dependent dehydrogenase (short-subunit alcohol dehydrogenase family)